MLWTRISKTALGLAMKIIVAGIICFALSESISGSMELETLENAGVTMHTSDSEVWQKAILKFKEEKGLNQPSFYLSIKPKILKDLDLSEYKWVDKNTLEEIVLKTGSSSSIPKYIDFLNSTNLSISTGNLEESTRNKLLGKWIHTQNASSFEKLEASILDLRSDLKNHGLNYVDLSWEKSSPSLLQLCPSIKWNGSKNRFHSWIKTYLTGAWGYSSYDGEKVLSKIARSFRVTFIISLFALVIGLIISLISGLWSIEHSKSKASGWFYLKTLILLSVPSFWLATLLIQWFGTGGFLSIFSSVSRPFSELDFMGLIKHYCLPILCLVAGIWAIMHQQIFFKGLEIKAQNFIKAAKYRGVNQKTIRWNYLLPNTAFPLISALSVIIPALLTGALAIELIFDIPGIGKLLYQSILRKDWNVTFPLIYINMLIVIVVNLIANWLYFLIDPRIRKKSMH